MMYPLVQELAAEGFPVMRSPTGSSTPTTDAVANEDLVG
jgi:hypothetical protein